MPRKKKRGYTLRAISPDDDVSGLSLGDDDLVPLEEFLKRDAKRYHNHNAAKTYVIVSDESPKAVVGYISLLCGHIQLDTPPDGLSGYDCKDFEDFPAVKIARLAVDHRQGGNKFGTKLVDWAMAIASTKIMPHIGCRFVVLDSKKGAIKFYERYGFTLVDTEKNKQQKYPVMFIDIGKIGNPK